MSSRCSSAECLNGNCEGCKNGVKFCDDPRCYPSCPDCTGETSLHCDNKRDGWDWALIIILGVLTIILLIIIGYMMWSYGCNSSVETDIELEDTTYYPYEYQSGVLPGSNLPSTDRVSDFSNQYRQAQLASPPPPSIGVRQALDNSVNTTAGPGLPSTERLPGFPTAGLDNPANVSVGSANIAPPVKPSVSDTTIRGFPIL